MTARRQIILAAALILLSISAFVLAALQFATLVKACERNLPSVGTEGTGLVRESGATVVRCRYSDVGGHDVEFAISVAPLVLVLILTCTISLIALQILVGATRHGRSKSPAPH